MVLRTAIWLLAQHVVGRRETEDAVRNAAHKAREGLPKAARKAGELSTKVVPHGTTAESIGRNLGRTVRRNTDAVANQVGSAEEVGYKLGRGLRGLLSGPAKTDDRR